MELSLMLLEQIIVMVLMALCGFVVSRLGFLSSRDSSTISKVCIYIVAPSTLLDGFQTEFASEKLAGLGIVAALAAGIFGLFLLVGTILRKHSPCPITAGEQCCITYANSGNLVMPLVQNTLGPGYLIYTCAFQLVQNILMWTHAKTLMSGQKSFSLRTGLLNVNICSIYIGLAMFLLRIRLPEPFAGGLHTMASMLGPLSMLILGITLAEMDLKAALTSLRVYLVVALRLVCLPLLSLLLLLPVRLLWHGTDASNVLTVALLCCSGPTATLMVQMAQLYDSPEREHVAFINATSTILCALSIPLMSALFLWLRG